MERPPPGSRGAGKRFGRYLLLDSLDRGGMAEVYRAVMHGPGGFQRQFVIKRIRKEKATSRDFVDMFINEARISAMLDHPNIVQVYDFGHFSGDYFLAMEYLRGKNLLAVVRRLRQNKRDIPRWLGPYVVQQVARGLNYAHSLVQNGKPLGIIHRDVTPTNIMLLRTGGVKLLDFGIARAEMKLRSTTPTGGLIKGKFAYMSPEQVRGLRLDGRSDIFSLGVILWECLTGRRLFADPDDMQIMKNVLEQGIPRPSQVERDVPAVLDDIAMRALERIPEHRYQQAGAMAANLEGYLRDSHVSPDDVVRLLDDLFGDEESARDAALPEDTAVNLPGLEGIDEPAEAGADESPAGHEARHAREARETVKLPIDILDKHHAPDGDGGYVTVSSIRPRVDFRPRGRRKVVAAALGVLAIASAVFIVRLVREEPETIVPFTAFSTTEASPAGSAAPAPAEPPTPAPPPVARVAPGEGAKAAPPEGAKPEGSTTGAELAPAPVASATASPESASPGSRAQRGGSKQTGRRADASVARRMDRDNERLARGLEALRSGELKRALEELQGAVAHEPNNANALGALAEVEFELTLYDRALAHVRRASRLAPRGVSHRILEGDLYFKLGRYSAAAAAYKAAARLAPSDPIIAERLRHTEDKLAGAAN